MKEGILFTFEGGEGAGKSTLIEGISRYLVDAGYQVVTTREPGGTKLSEHIRRWLLERDADVTVGSKAELLLFLAARMQNLEETIIPAMEQGNVVLCDRYNDSSIAYQGYARGLGAPWVESLCDTACQHLLPTLTFFLDIDPEEGLKRTRRTGDTADRIDSETLHFHEAVREGYLALAQQHPQRILVLDASLPCDAVLKAACRAAEGALHAHF